MNDRETQNPSHEQENVSPLDGADATDTEEANTTGAADGNVEADTASGGAPER